jgi:hypothetical protein
MRNIVLRFGLASGVILALVSGVMLPLCMKGIINFQHQEVLGYTAMVLSFLMVFFGIRSYRDTVAGGAIGFGKAFQVGILICLVTCAMYVLGWEIAYFNFFPDFFQQYSASVLAKMHARGASEADIQKTAADGGDGEALPQPLLQLRHHLHGGLPGRADRDAGLRRDPAPEAAAGGSRVGRAGLTGLEP